MRSDMINFRAMCVLAVGLVASLVTPAVAEIILDVGPQSHLQGRYGEGPDFYAYAGQTFTALGPAVTEMTFYLRSNTPAPNTGNMSNWRILLTETMGGSEWDNPYGIHPTNVLFESETFSYNSLRVSSFHVDFGHIPLTPGATYMWIFDSFVVWDSLLDAADISVNIYNPYSEGHSMLAYAWGSSGTRADHFSGNWHHHMGTDRIFRMTFVPEPGTAGVLAATGGLLFLLRRRAA